MRTNSKIFAQAATAGAITLAASALVTPASAFFAGTPYDHPAMQQPSEIGRPALTPQRPMRTRAPITAARPPKDTAVPNELANKANGPLQVIISLDKQQLTLYAGGQPIAHSRVSSGQRGRATPTGVFSVIQKDRWHRSNLYDNAPMYYMQRITWSGVALHQGIVPNYPASHGCVRLPEAFAKQLWGITKLGARVIIARGEVAPIEIAHPKLFAPKAPTPLMSQIEALKVAQQTWTFADLASKDPLVGASLTDLPSFSIPADPSLQPAKPPVQARPLKPGPVSVFISRKEGKLFVRKGFEPLFDTPVTIENPDQPLGTHVFTATTENDDKTAMRWNVVSMAHAAAGSPASAAGALDRIAIPQDARDRISELLSVGASLIISDQGLGPETGKGTDFIVLTR